MVKKTIKIEPATKEFVSDEIRRSQYDIFQRLDDHDQSFIEIKEVLNRIANNTDFLVGAYQKFDEEHTILSHQVSDHDDRIVELEKGSSEAN
jgi:hypothetical protein